MHIARRSSYKTPGILASVQSDINTSPFAADAQVTAAEIGTIGRPRSTSLSKQAADSAHPAFQSQRLKSIDIARGATVAVMIFVNHAGREPAWLGHAAWDGLHLADLVMPCFLLLVGLSAALSLSTQRQRGASRRSLLWKALCRSGKMAALGLLIQGGAVTQAFPAWDLSQLRYFGVLQRIALCFLLASLVVIYLPESRPFPAQEWLDEEESSSSSAMVAPLRFYAFWWSFALAHFAAFTGMALLLLPPGCSKRPALSPACNVAAWVDQGVMGRQHMYPFATCRHAEPPCPYLDPEGLFATLGGGAVSTFIGLWFGAVLLTLRSHRARLQSWGIGAALLVELGCALHLTGAVPINKSLYSASYVLVTAGISGAFLCVTYLFSDVLQSKAFAKAAEPCLWLGMNAILVYVGDEVLERAIPWVYWGEADSHLLSWIRRRFQLVFGAGWAASVALALANVAFWMVVAGVLHRKRWYLKV